MTQTDPLAALGGTRRAYVLPELRILYVSVAKNACTSIKWMLAGLAGEDTSTFSVTGLSSRLHAEHGIHDRAKWQHVPTLGRLAPAVRQDIHPDNGWFVFALIRDPRSRLFSAWQQKFLLREPGYHGFLSEPWHPRLPADAQTIVEDFARFVDVLDADVSAGRAHALMIEDAHFMTQANLVRTDIVPYTRIYDVREMSTLTRDLSAHLTSIGHTGALIEHRSNDTPLRANAMAFPDDVRFKVERIYAQDFETLDGGWDFDTIASGAAWSAGALRDAFARAETAQRFTEVRRVAMRGNRQVERLRARNVVLERRLARATADTEAVRTTVPLADLMRERVAARFRRLRRRVRRRLRRSALGRSRR